MEMPRTLADFEARAAEILEEGPHGYYAGGAADELTLRANVEAWRRIAIRPRVLVDVSERNSRDTVLGRVRPHPVFVAPTAFHGLADPQGEGATARAAAAAGAVFCLSSLAGAGPAEIAAAAPSGERWFQLYVFRDRGLSNQLVRRRRRERVRGDRGHRRPAGARDPRSRPADPVHASRRRSLAPERRAGAPPSTSSRSGELIDPSLTWVDIERLVERSELPVS